MGCRSFVALIWTWTITLGCKAAPDSIGLIQSVPIRHISRSVSSRKDWCVLGLRDTPRPDDGSLREPAVSAWAPVPRELLVIWLLFFAVFLYQFVPGTGVLLLMDNVFIPIHEQRWSSPVPLVRYDHECCGRDLSAALRAVCTCTYFARQRHPKGVAFCMFFFFEQLEPIARYLADARAQELPLLTVGDAEYVIQNWNFLFTKRKPVQRL